MKIVSNEKYEELVSFKKRFENLEKRHDELLLESVVQKQQLKDKIAFSFTLSRAIVGKKGSGKTELIKSFLKQMNPNSYFLIDRNNEYENVPISSKFSPDNKNSTSLGELKKQIIEKIKQNSSKIIVLEDAYYYDDNLNWFFDVVGSGKFIFVAQSLSRIPKHILGDVDFIYDAGCFEKITDFESIPYEKYYFLTEEKINEIILKQH